MKLITFTVPCYNSEKYMHKCIDSLLIGGDNVEILIVNDGSTKDRTAEIADEYEAKYPGIIRAIHQENKGHGGAVNTGLANATGLYFKVVDSDDWVDPEAYKKVLATLEKVTRGPQTLDVLITNYVYEKEGAKKKRVMKYTGNFPEDKIFTWDQSGKLPATRYVLMHSLTFRTELLREVNLKLPEHTFYVDNLVAYIPFIKVKTLYYLNANLYRYYIGRADQSVNEKVMLTRIDQQLRVNHIMLDYLDEVKKLKGRQWEFMVHSLSIIMCVTSIMLIRSKSKDCLQKKKELWSKLKRNDYGVYLKIRWNITGSMMNLPGHGGRSVSVFAYKLMQRVYGFN